MLKKDLEKIGLNPKEVDVYLALLDMGEANIQQIVEKSEIKRTTVYDVLELLKDKGLVSETNRKKRTFYLAEDPRKIGENLKERHEIVQRIMPELLAMNKQLIRKPKIRYFEGVDGIREVYKDTLHYPDQEILAWMADEAIEKFDADFLENYYVPERLEHKIWMRAIAPDHAVMCELQKKDKESLRKIKLIPHDKFPFDVEINLYGQSLIAIMSFEEQVGMIIESPKIYKTLKSIFELQWDKDSEE